MEEFLHTLRCMQNLVDLHLEEALAITTGFLSSSTIHSFQMINLPRLPRLLITPPLPTVIALLSSTIIPLKAQARLDCRRSMGDDEPSPDEYSQLCSLLAGRFGASEDQAIQPDNSFIGYCIIYVGRGETEAQCIGP